MEAILTRRSIRQYTSQPVPEQLVKHLLEAAMSAPSAGNEQPWQFVVIRDRQTLDAIPTAHPNAGAAKQAPLVIVVCGDLHLQKYPGLWVQDCSAATQNLLLAARAANLGSLWCGVYPEAERVSAIRQLLGLPEHVLPLSLVVIGYPAESKGREERFDAKRVHSERW
jgi:nitroreductase